MDDSSDGIAHWRQFLIPINEVKVDPPKWVLPMVLPPGFTILAGDPKTFKSTLIYSIVAAITEGLPLGEKEHGRVCVKPGSAIYVGTEQTAGRIRAHYEDRVLKRKLPDAKVSGAKLSFSLLKEPWEWRLDVPQPPRMLVELMMDLKPTLFVLDPLIHFHEQDENDPAIIRFIAPLQRAAHSYGGSLVIVHHAKKQSQSGPAAPSMTAQKADWSRIRGTSALWGMADAGIMTSMIGKEVVNVQCEFKDFPAHSFTWRPG